MGLTPSSHPLEMLLFTEASTEGWGAHLQGLVVSDT